MLRTLLHTALLGGLLGLPVAATALPITLFEDGFEGESPSASELNFTGFLNWSVTGGTVDLKAQGNIWGIDCAGGAGFCVDLDGSTMSAGTLTSNTIFDFLAGITYTLSLDISGNQRTSAADSVLFGLSIDSLLVTVLGTDLFQTFDLIFTPLSDFSSALFIQGFGGDNIGAILDNVLLTYEQPPVPVPEPGALVLFALGLGLLRLSLRHAPRRSAG